MLLLSIVVPVYNEVDNIIPFLRDLGNKLESIALKKEIIFVCDPSSDGTEDLIKNLSESNPEIYLIELTRKFGQAKAILAGLEYSSGDAIVVMDVDLQDPPEVIPKMITKWESGTKLVIAQRESREGEPLIKKLIAKLGYWFLNKFAEIPIPRNTGDFRLMDRQIVNELLKFPEASFFLRGLVSLVGYNYEIITFKRLSRNFGKSQYNKFFGSISIAIDGIIGFSTVLLRISIFFGIVMAGFTSLFTLIYLAAKISGIAFPEENPTLVILVSFISSLLFIIIGVQGLYVGKIYDEVKHRPRYLVKAIHGTPQKTKNPISIMNDSKSDIR
jgi:glycosyltransferase involved in cell wall biosynthesis